VTPVPARRHPRFGWFEWSVSEDPTIIHKLWINCGRRLSANRPGRCRQGVPPRRAVVEEDAVTEPAAVDLDLVWSRATARLTDDDVSAQHRAWLRQTRPLGLMQGTVVVATPNDFVRDVLDTKLRHLVLGALARELDQDIRLAVIVEPDVEAAAESEPADVAPEEPAPAFPSGGGQPAGPAEPAHLNPKYQFETFVIGSSNRFAHAAAVAVAEAPAKAYNPLFIYGESGLGKTHLLHAIGHYSQHLFAGSRVRYVSSEEFTNDFINSIRDGRAELFRKRYRDIDVLLVDDIQFLENKEQTQEEFFHTFNTLHNANKQIVISSDRPPKQLVTLEDRLRNRFEWGLITDITPPELETRIAILRRKAAQERLAAPPEVLEFIAGKIASNIRELEGALIRVTAFASLNRQNVDLPLAEVVLKDLIADAAGPEITASLIMGQTAAYFGVSIDDLCGSSRSRVLVTARQIAMYLCRELTDLSLPKIGQQFGGRDHTTVMHAERKIRGLMSERRSVFNQVSELTGRIKSQARTA
jgi:chromosomal replication initiator protein